MLHCLCAFFQYFDEKFQIYFWVHSDSIAKSSNYERNQFKIFNGFIEELKLHGRRNYWFASPDLQRFFNKKKEIEQMNFLCVYCFTQVFIHFSSQVKMILSILPHRNAGKRDKWIICIHKLNCNQIFPAFPSIDASN